MSRFFTVALVTVACQTTPFSSASTDPGPDGSMADASFGGGANGDASVGAGGSGGSPARGGSSGSHTGGAPGAGGGSGGNVTARDAATTEAGNASCAAPPIPDDRVYAEVTNDGAPLDDFIYLDLYITNGTNQALSLGAIEIRYYFTAEPITESIVELMFAAQYDNYIAEGYVEHDPALVEATVVGISPVSGADHYVQITPSDSLGSLGPGGELELGLSIHLPDYAVDYDETDDYSFSGCASRVLEDGIVVLGDGGAVLYGIPPTP